MGRWLKSQLALLLAMFKANATVLVRKPPIERASEVPDQVEVLDALARIDRSAEVGASPTIRRFLNFVVRETLAGKSSDLKESVIGVDVFAKEPGWDSRSDSTVRTNATRVRAKLRKYYEAEGLKDPVIIELDGGTYVPKFRFRTGLLAPPVYRRTPRPSLPIAGTIALLALLAYAANLIKPDPIVTSCLPLTSDGRPKTGPILTDGRTIYFEEQIEDKWLPVAVPAGGGTVTPLEVPLDSCKLLDWSETRHSFLTEGTGPDGKPGVWEWTPGQTPVLLAGGAISAGSWMAPGTAAVSNGTRELQILQGGKLIRTLEVPGKIGWSRWLSAGGPLRMTLYDTSAERFSLWDLLSPEGELRQVSGYPPRACCGTRAAKADLFIFETRGEKRTDIWGSLQSRSMFTRKEKPFRLTNGPLDFSFVLPSADGKRVFAVGATSAAELVRYDFSANQFVPYLNGLKGYEVDYSRNQEWLAYVSYPDKCLWKIRSDGTERTQLTFPPLKTNQPHWSPMGDSIAFMGLFPDGRRRVHIISSLGGPAEQLIESGTDQGVPTFSADGTQIAFGQLRERKASQHMTVQILDLATRKLSVVPGSTGIWTPRWSPDGRFLAGLTPDFGKLLLFDFRSSVWGVAAEIGDIDDPVWTADSSYLYFRARDSVDLPSRGQILAIYRFHISSRQVERVIGIRNLASPPGGEGWFGLTPDWHPLSIRGLQTQEIYAMDLK